MNYYNKHSTLGNKYAGYSLIMSSKFGFKGVNTCCGGDSFLPYNHQTH